MQSPPDVELALGERRKHDPRNIGGAGPSPPQKREPDGDLDILRGREDSCNATASHSVRSVNAGPNLHSDRRFLSHFREPCLLARN